MGCQKLLSLCAPFFSLISDGLGGVKLFIDANVYAHATAAGNKKISDKKASV